MIAHNIVRGMMRHRALANPHGRLVFISGWNGGSENLLSVGFRDQIAHTEIASDRMTVWLLAAAGYDPGSLRAYLARRQTDGHGTLPPRSFRMAALSAELWNIAPSVYRRTPNNFELIQQELRSH
jgi:hypothetical protein